MNRYSPSWYVRIITAILISLAVSWSLSPADEGHEHTGSGTLHFSHPLIAESPSPDSKVRFDYFSRNIDDADEKAKENTIRFEGEYALHRSLSVELDIAYLFLNPEGEQSESNLEDFEIGLKFANFEFKEHNLLLGYGIEFGFPVGDEEKGIGSSHIFVVEPFFNMGYLVAELEIVAFASFGIPTNQREDEEVETEFGYNLSFLYHLSPAWEGLIELDGETVLSGEERGKSVVNFTPGVKLRPLKDSSFKVGLGVSFPISNREEFDIQVLGALFHHF